jgi:hypothetical protein
VERPGEDKEEKEEEEEAYLVMGRCRSRWQCCGHRRCFQRRRERD